MHKASVFSLTCWRRSRKLERIGIDESLAYWYTFIQNREEHQHSRSHWVPFYTLLAKPVMRNLWMNKPLCFSSWSGRHPMVCASKKKIMRWIVRMLIWSHRGRTGRMWPYVTETFRCNLRIQKKMHMANASVYDTQPGMASRTDCWIQALSPRSGDLDQWLLRGPILIDDWTCTPYIHAVGICSFRIQLRSGHRYEAGPASTRREWLD